jgi:hypothetical protein
MTYRYFDKHLGSVTVENIFSRTLCASLWSKYGIQDKYSERYYQLITIVVPRANKAATSNALIYAISRRSIDTLRPGKILRQIKPERDCIWGGSEYHRIDRIVKDDALYASTIQWWSAKPTYEDILSYIPLPTELADKIFSYLAAGV